MGQRGLSSNSRPCNCTEDSLDTTATDPSAMLPTEPVDMEVQPIPFPGEQRPWLSVVESQLVHEWLAGRRRQSQGVLATSPHVPLTCDRAEFPVNRSTGIVHTNPKGTEGIPTEVPVGKEFFQALRAEWSKPAKDCDIVPPTSEDDLESTVVGELIEGAVGCVMSPTVPLPYMVKRVLVQQWVEGGM